MLESRVWQSFRFDAIQLEIVEQPCDDDFFEKFFHGTFDNGSLRVTNVSDADERRVAERKRGSGESALGSAVV